MPDAPIVTSWKTRDGHPIHLGDVLYDPWYCFPWRAEMSGMRYAGPADIAPWDTFDEWHKKPALYSTRKAALEAWLERLADERADLDEKIERVRGMLAEA